MIVTHESAQKMMDSMKGQMNSADHQKGIQTPDCMELTNQVNQRSQMIAEEDS